MTLAEMLHTLKNKMKVIKPRPILETIRATLTMASPFLVKKLQLKQIIKAHMSTELLRRNL